MRRITIFQLIFIANAFCLSAIELTDTTVVKLKEVVVDAQRNKLFSETGKRLISIGSEEIQLMPVQTAEELLRMVPGVDLRQRGQAGTQADISIRGGSFDQVMVLLNGIDMTDPQTGHHNMNLPVDVESLTGIEVLHGSSSKRYGTQAFSGAVNFSIVPADENRVTASVGYGSFNTYQGHAAVNLVRRSIRNFSAVSYAQSDGYKANTDFSRLNIYSLTNWNSAIAGNFDFQLGLQQKSFGANGFYSLAYPNQFEHTSSAFAAISWSKKINKLDFSAQVHSRRHYDRFELFRDFTGAATWYQDHNYHQTYVSGAAFQLQYLSRAGKFSGGLSLRNDHVFSTVLGDLIEDESDRPLNYYEKDQEKYFSRQAGRFMQQLFVDYAGSWKGFYLSAGASLSNSRDYNLHFNYGLELSYLVNDDFSVYVAANTATRLPTFTDLYYKSATQDANPLLQPEHSATTEAGLKYTDEGLSIQSAVFYRRGTNIIDWVKFPEAEKWQSLNLTAVNTLGADLSVTYTFKKSWLNELNFSYAYLQNDKLAAGFDSKYALDYMKHQLNFRLTHEIFANINAAWNVSLNDRAGQYTDFITKNPVDYTPYLLADTRISWNLSALKIFVDIKNLLNSIYVDYGGLVLPGFHANLGVKWEIK